ESFDLELESGPFHYLPAVNATSRRIPSRIPLREFVEMNNGVEHIGDRPIDDLRNPECRHLVAGPIARHFSNIAANGRASNTTRVRSILPSLTWCHSAMNAVPAGVLVTMSYNRHTSSPSGDVFLTSTRSTIVFSCSSEARSWSGLLKVSIGPWKRNWSCKSVRARPKSPDPTACMYCCTTAAAWDAESSLTGGVIADPPAAPG